MTDPDEASYRTDDLTYGEEYWATLDGGAGYQDSLMWSDIGHIVHETFGIDTELGVDKALQMSVLDVGCAMGFLLRHLRKRGYDVRGVDFSEYALENAPGSMSTYLSFFDLTDQTETLAEHEGRQFDLVTCFETLEHIPEEHVETALASIASAVAPTGFALLTICTDKQPGWDSDPTHVTVKPREWWVPRLRAAGLLECRDIENDIRRYWLFSRHDGVFVVSH